MSIEYYFISDLHLGGTGILDKCNFEKDLINFLIGLQESGQKIELIMVGDIFGMREISDTSIIGKFNKIVETNKEIFNQFKISGEKIKITLIVGNHDMELIGEPKIKIELKKYGINLEKSQYINRKLGNKKIRIEHGNQFDNYNKYSKRGDVTKHPIGYNFNRNLVNKIENYIKGSRSKWILDVVNVQPYKDIPFWIFSNYFYKEMNPILRYSIVPFFMMITLTIIVLIITLLQKFGIIEHKIFIQNFKEYFGVFGNILDFIILINSIILGSLLIVGLPLAFFIRDFFKAIKKFNFPIYQPAKKKCYLKEIRNIFQKDTSLDIFIFGHTHEPMLIKEKINGKFKYIINTGTWVKSHTKMRSWSRFLPSIYISYQTISYFRIFEKKGTVRIEYDYKLKYFGEKQTLLEKILTIGKKSKLTNKIPRLLILK